MDDEIPQDLAELLELPWDFEIIEVQHGDSIVGNSYACH